MISDEWHHVLPFNNDLQCFLDSGTLYEVHVRLDLFVEALDIVWSKELKHTMLL